MSTEGRESDQTALEDEEPLPKTAQKDDEDHVHRSKRKRSTALEDEELLPKRARKDDEDLGARLRTHARSRPDQKSKLKPGNRHAREAMDIDTGTSMLQSFKFSYLFPPVVEVLPVSNEVSISPSQLSSNSPPRDDFAITESSVQIASVHLSESRNIELEMADTQATVAISDYVQPATGHHTNQDVSAVYAEALFDQIELYPAHYDPSLGIVVEGNDLATGTTSISNPVVECATVTSGHVLESDPQPSVVVESLSSLSLPASQYPCSDLANLSSASTIRDDADIRVAVYEVLRTDSPLVPTMDVQPPAHSYENFRANADSSVEVLTVGASLGHAEHLGPSEPIATQPGCDEEMPFVEVEDVQTTVEAYEVPRMDVQFDSSVEVLTVGASLGHAEHLGPSEPIATQPDCDEEMPSVEVEDVQTTVEPYEVPRMGVQLTDETSRVNVQSFSSGQPSEAVISEQLAVSNAELESDRDESLRSATSLSLPAPQIPYSDLAQLSPVSTIRDDVDICVAVYEVPRTDSQSSVEVLTVGASLGHSEHLGPSEPIATQPDCDEEMPSVEVEDVQTTVEAFEVPIMDVQLPDERVPRMNPQPVVEAYEVQRMDIQPPAYAYEIFRAESRSVEVLTVGASLGHAERSGPEEPSATQQDWDEEMPSVETEDVKIRLEAFEVPGTDVQLPDELSRADLPSLVEIPVLLVN
ncbi:hypothetical protein D9758_015357 [Tetrapyrgos nigripes]|uniref:Uncharacterized protein n=1 Tax=Tetrapyrgos nigripes TaxID=182062 RepID=A0A8H5CMV4_9AGAR|nr:hypothetical protein D9758_015357 [Tetrapyrgos nigripes]